MVEVKDVFSIRGYVEEDRTKVLELISSFFDDVGCTEKWREFYENSPNGDAVRIVAEYAANRAIFGHYSVLKTPMIMFGKKYCGGKGEAAIIDPSLLRLLLKQGIKLERSILSGLITDALKSAHSSGIVVICSNPNRLALKAHIESGHSRLEHKFTVFSFPISKRYCAYLVSKKIKIKVFVSFLAFILACFYNFLHIFRAVFPDKSKVKLAQIKSFGTELAQINDDFLSSYNCITMERRSDYFNWRFKSDDYKKFLVGTDDKVVGYVIIRIFTASNGFKEADLTDYLFGPRYWYLFTGVMTKIIEFCKSEGCDALRVDYMHDYKENFGVSSVLKRLFFLHRGDERNIVTFLPLMPEDERARALDIENWFFTNLYFGAY